MKNGFIVLTVFFVILASSLAFGQKAIGALRINDEITLDGNLSETFWQQAEMADSFVVNYPKPNVLSDFHTTVHMVYDDQAIYFGVRLYDPRPDSLMPVLSQRDDFGNADWFGVQIDPYGAGQNAFGFYVTAAGVEIDAIETPEDKDYSWNTVWKSRVQLTEYGWSIEIRIPLSQLRFPKVDMQDWRINFQRQVRRNRESSFWSPVDPTVYGSITQSGNVKELTNLRSPLRLSFSPYATSYVENYYNEQSLSQDWRFRQRFGMDMKYGLSEAFTLDATLVPDFGQTTSDKLVLNLSPFEVRYNENRPFFLEGIDLFGTGDMFYSRRIGAEPYLGYRADSLNSAGNKVTSAPALAQLVNASKISGRTKKGLGVGFFNAIEKRSYITYEDSAGNKHEMLAHPLTNYNILVLSQNLKNNCNVGFVNTHVYRPDLNQFADATNLQTTLLTPNRKYSLFLFGRTSVLGNTDKTTFGHNFYTSFKKISGRFTYNLEYYETSHTFDINDLGYIARNNIRGISAFFKLAAFEPKGKLLRKSISLTSDHVNLYKPSKYNYWNLNIFSVGTFRNFLTCGLELDMSPIGQVDHFESRTFGVPVNRPASFSLGGFYSSNYSKKYALDFSVYNRVFTQSGMNNLDAEVSPRIQVSNKCFVVLTAGISRYLNDYGYVRVQDTAYSDVIILGTRNRWIVNNSIAADYMFTNRMGLTLRFNHYWQEVAYSKFGELQSSGWTNETTYTGRDTEGNSLHNTSYNAFTVDMNFRWVIYPGSELRFVWKYNIYASRNALDLSYFKTFNGLFDQPQLNSFSVKALFFLNAGNVKRKKK